MKRELEIYKGEFGTREKLPFADDGVRAGFPSPAQDYLDKSLDFNKELIPHPSATFYAKVSGDSMIDAGIGNGDIVVVDRALEARHKDVVVAFINGEFTLKYLDLSEKKKGRIWLRPGNRNYPPFCITKGDELIIWGVVSKVIKNLR